ncbi:MAG: endonuclease/exonuclease/phosphatase family protein [Terrimicrobiaceae bacterium]|nr:endonuclease/exonuclease/phosphatase family protein [Terrimicrobiaceae bacterium]
MIRILVALVVLLSVEAHGNETFRIVAANLTAGRHQTYSPDNANHSNPEGAGARILRALKPDIVLIQEFQTTIPRRQWINQTFGTEFSFMVEEGEGIPNGVISRFPIIESGEWDCARLENRDFAWARIALPGGQKLLAVSVHFYAQKARDRTAQARQLVDYIRNHLRPGEWLVVGGDLNVRSEQEEAVVILGGVIDIPKNLPADQAGNSGTNGPRSAPYDWVLVSAPLAGRETPVRLGGHEFPGGLVFDSRAFDPLAAVAPVQADDSAVFGMQHMAVMRDFRMPAAGE